nr:MAG TPA: hypothetical protein [Caudoviricetes sp.]
MINYHEYSKRGKGLGNPQRSLLYVQVDRSTTKGLTTL